MTKIKLSLCLSFRLLRDYEFEEGAFTFKQDLFDHVETEKENIMPSTEVTIKLICKAVSELWLSDIICCQRS